MKHETDWRKEEKICQEHNSTPEKILNEMTYLSLTYIITIKQDYGVF